MTKGPTKSMWIRMVAVMLTVIVGTATISGYRLVKLMVVDSDFYQTKASQQQLYDTVLSAPRGDIYDANHKLLATSSPVWTVYITPYGIAEIKDDAKRQTVKNLIADNLSQILQVDRDKILSYTEKTGSHYVIIKKKVEKEIADQVRKFITDNSDYQLSAYIGLDEATTRSYPNNSLASVVLGFVGDDNQGLSGIESYYDTELTGVPGRVVAAKNAHGTDMPFSYEKVVEAKSGNSLVLTIDSYIQYVAEKYLDEAVKNNKVEERGVALVMNVKTGAILGMAVKGDFDPNDPFTLSESDQKLLEGLEGDERTKMLSDLRNKQWRNKAVSDPYEPGSVFKVITAAIALEENLTSFNSSFFCPGYIVVAGQRYSCHKHSGHGSQNLQKAMQNSCNPAFITLGQLVGVSTFSKYFEAFGLTQKTGIDLPGEATSAYHAEKNMGPVELASTSFGQTFKITPIQLLTAVSAVVNGGYLVKPHVVSQILDSDGGVVKSVGTTTKRQVISAETSKKMCQLLEGVVSDGGGRNAYAPGFKLGGKTGTSQKVAEMLATGESGLYVASFCGIAPMDDPQVAVLVLLDEPHGDSYYGGTISAPVGGQILSDVLPYLGYEPQYTEEELANLAIPVPSVQGQSLAEAKQKVQQAGLTSRVIGNGKTVVKQLPAATQSIYKNGVVILYTEEQADTTVKVPNLTGLTVSQVNQAAAAAGINVEFSGYTLSGSGVKSYRQSVAKDTAVPAGTVVTVYFRDSDTGDLAE